MRKKGTRVALQLWSGLAAALCLSQVAQAQDFTTIEQIGVRVASGTVDARQGQVVNVLNIVAVHRDGPAYYAALQPGDQIVALGQARFPTVRSIVDFFERWHQPGNVVQFQMRGANEDGGFGRPEYVSVESNGEDAGDWITQPLWPTSTSIRGRHQLPAFVQVVAEARAKFDALQQELSAMARTAACDFSLDEPDVTVKVREWETWMNRGNAPWTMADDFARMAETECSIARSGGLPEFEAILFGVVAREIDPCTLSSSPPRPDRLKEITEGQSIERYNSLSIVWFSNYLRDEPPEKVSCLFSFLRSRMFGGAPSRN
jgi:hypothetical protein